MARGSSRAQSELGDKDFQRAQKSAKYAIEAIEKLLKKSGLDEPFMASIRADAKALVEQIKPGVKAMPILNKLTDLRDEVTDEIDEPEVRKAASDRVTKPKDLKLDVVVDKGAGPITPAMAAERLKALTIPTEHDDPRVNYDDAETSKYITMNDTRRELLNPNSKTSVELMKSPYASRVLDMTKEDVKAALANTEVRKYVMQVFAKDNYANLVNRDKFGNWATIEMSGRVKGVGRVGMRSIAEVSDYGALAKTMLKHEAVAERVFQLIDNR